MVKTEPGLVSVTFRKLGVEEIVALCVRAGVRAVEWGGDVHVPDEAAARRTAALMDKNNLTTVSYGSYYRAGKGEDFAPVLAAAAALKAPNIRIWAGEKNPDEADDAYRSAVAADIKAACEMAAARNITVASEYHGNTLTNTQESAVALIRQVSTDNFYSYWQPLANTTHGENLRNIRELCGMGKLLNMHVYYSENRERKPLSGGAGVWAEYFKAAEGHCNYALLEFVIADDPEQYIADAASLKALLK